MNNMGDDEKKFELPEIVIILMLAIINDAADVAADFSLAIPVVGEVIFGFLFLINLVVSAIIILWFIMKSGVAEGMGARGTAAVIAGRIAEFFGLPAGTLTAAIGTYLANHPEAAALASAATGKVGAAREISAVEKEAAAAGKIGEKAESAAAERKRIRAAGEAEARAEGAPGEPAPGEGIAPEIEAEKAERREKEQKIEEALTPEEARPPIERAKEAIPEIFPPKEIPQPILNEKKNEVDLSEFKKAA